jgi:hypothetical protein
MSASASAAPIITTEDIQLLVSGYAHDSLQQWGEAGLPEQVLERGPEIVIIGWELNELMGQLVGVVNPNSPQKWILWIIVTPEWLWLGLHAVQTSAPSK